MVALKKMGWFSELSIRKHGDNTNEKGIFSSSSSSPESKKSDNMGILAFETGRTMSKLVSLYKSLSDAEISRLKNEVTRSQGIRYLNSMDQGLLMSLACAERLEDLDKAANVVIRLGQKCRDFGLNRFDLVYMDLKLGIVDFKKLVYGSREIEKMIGKMERLVSATSNLYTSLEALSGLEMSERRMNQWKDKAPPTQPKPNVNLFKQKLESQRKQVQYFRETSLWSKTFDKSVGLMGRVVCFVYARLCAVFSSHVPVPSSVCLRNTRSSLQSHENILKFQPEYCLIEPIMKEQVRSHSGSIVQGTNKPILVRFYSQRSKYFQQEDDGFGSLTVTKHNRVFHAAGPSTVGGCGLALRYANVILMAEKCLYSGESVDPETRQSMYEMLPENLKSLVKSKLSKNVKGTEHDESLASGWREALKEILGWLAPMADDTVQWHLERNPDKMKFDAKPPVLLLQTLHFSDKEKTEAAIVEVLVSLSCILRHENRLL
ncbi:OLC1v1034897C1 [Oldenlandia corymbosa var. corymbosa]|uniref:OLC1v1034897C1 n=1 Tax=Oldenlandia corymbosa var. corymbosa TaxID=529605 RepID=A0AAV1CUU9_OLDCO|nr:OLC1v1034897C1 [Oldenlandia corymbosa var. corymbosa]